MLKGFELEGEEDLKERFQNIVVGEIKEIEKHPNADKLQLAKVEVGEKNGGELKIVCGAFNIKVGHKVPVALAGAVLPVNKFQIKKTEIRGEVSNGMLCAEDELGIGKDHSGILILSDEAKMGQSVAEVLGLDDTILEFDILPNRAHDCLSYRGMANEICAMEGEKFKSQKNKNPLNPPLAKEENKGDLLNIEIREKELCPRYIGAVLENIEIKPSPRWMQNRLIASGMEPINNVVDITNYVMLEIGSPLHCFDFNNLAGEESKKRIIVRKAESEEELELLDDNQLKLDEKDLVIADQEKAIGLAGIKGGKYSGISADTKKIVLEAANFNGFKIRKTRQRHNLLTEAQQRFEKNLSPCLAEDAARRAIELLIKYANANLIDYADEDQSSFKEGRVNLNLEKAESLLGEELDQPATEKILENLGFKILKKDQREIEVEVPYWRLDVESSEDLIEEIGRIKGYEKIQEQPIITETKLPQKNRKREVEWQIRHNLTGLGYDELINYSFYSQKDAEICGINKKHYEIQAPFSREVEILRQTLLPALLKKTALNASFFEDFKIFELGRIYQTKDYPLEETKIAGASYNKNSQAEDNFFKLKNDLEAFLSHLTGRKAAFEPIESLSHSILNLSQSAAVSLEGKKVGEIGAAGQPVAKKYKIKGALSFFEISFEALVEMAGELKQFQPLQKYPVAERDLSMYIGPSVAAGRIEEIFKKQGGQLLQQVELFDVFFDKEKNKRSLAYHLIFGLPERTLKNEEVDEAMKKIISALEKEKIEIRSK